jgi:hypothetical protein
MRRPAGQFQQRVAGGNHNCSSAGIGLSNGTSVESLNENKGDAEMNRRKETVLLLKELWAILLLTVVIEGSAQAQTHATAANLNQSDAQRMVALMPRFRLAPAIAGFRLMPATSQRTNVGSNSFSLMPAAAGANLQVLGSGTLGRLTKWTGVTSSNFIIGDAAIFEDKFGQVGIGTDAPTSRLTVAGMIETTLGGLKFADGTVQTTSAAGSLFSVAHDATLIGNGSSRSTLGIAVPLALIGPTSSGRSVLKVVNTDEGFGIDVKAGDSVDFAGGHGVFSQGGNSDNFRAGDGALSRGGDSVTGQAGVGVGANGGDSSRGNAGVGLFAFGGTSDHAGGIAGDGIVVHAGFARNGAAKALAGNFTGDVLIDGALNVTGTKNFRIDNPLDPENKYLLHAAIESSEVLNIYSGNVVTDANGDAVVVLADWFEALNRDIRYQLTVVGTFAQAIVSEKVRHNRFAIRTTAPNVEVSWQVTGVRADPVMLRNPFKAEEDKPAHERGTYLTPEAYGQPYERGTGWQRHSELMRHAKTIRDETKK